MAANHFYLFYRSIGSYDSLQLHRPRKVHRRRQSRVLGHDAERYGAGTLRQHFGHLLIGLCHGGPRIAIMNARPFEGRGIYFVGDLPVFQRQVDHPAII